MAAQREQLSEVSTEGRRKSDLTVKIWDNQHMANQMHNK